MWWTGQEAQTPTLLFVGADITLAKVPAQVRYTWRLHHPTQEGVMYIRGWSAAKHKDLMRLMEGARIFYERNTPGRPRGTTDFDYEDYAGAFARMSTDEEGPPKSQAEFLARAGLSRDTFKRALKRWGMTWREFRREQMS